MTYLGHMAGCIAVLSAEYWPDTEYTLSATGDLVLIGVSIEGGALETSRGKPTCL